MKLIGKPIEIVEVRSATQVAAFVPMTTLPKRYAGKVIAIVEVDQPSETTNPAEAGLEGLDSVAECDHD